MRKNLYFRGSRVGPCADAPTLARSIPSFYGQMHDMSMSIAYDKLNAPQAFTLTHESSDLAHKTSLIISATQNHNKVHTHITVLLFTRRILKCRSQCFECCVITSVITGGIWPCPSIFTEPVIPFPFYCCYL